MCLLLHTAFTEVPLSMTVTVGLVAEFHCSSAAASISLLWFIDGLSSNDSTIIERGFYHQITSLNDVLSSILYAPGNALNNGSTIRCGVVGQETMLQLSDEAVLIIQGMYVNHYNKPIIIALGGTQVVSCPDIHATHHEDMDIWAFNCA